MKITWQGDLADDCTAQVGDLFAHCECMGDLIMHDPDDPKDKWRGEIWSLSVCRVDDEGFWLVEPDLFHSADHAGTVTSGDMARGIAEAIMRAAGSTKGVRKPKPSRHPCSERVKNLRAK
jgi:hypothetical protein